MTPRPPARKDARLCRRLRGRRLALERGGTRDNLDELGGDSRLRWEG